MNICISTEQAPKAIGPYSQAVQAGDFTFVSGCIPLNPESGEVVAGGVCEQATQAFQNLKAVLAAAGCSVEDVVKTTVFLADMNDFAAVNEVYGSVFQGSVLPARSAVQVAALPRKVLIEIEAIAHRTQQ